MTNLNITVELHELEALVSDAIFTLDLLKLFIGHPDVGLIIHGAVPFTAMFVAESYDYLCDLNPGFKSVLDEQHKNLVRASRHRAKFLRCTQAGVSDMLTSLNRISRQHREHFLGLHHQGFLAPVKRWAQPDLGFSTYDGHIFSTSHMSNYILGEQQGRPLSFAELGSLGRKIGEAIGAYTQQLNNMLNISQIVRERSDKPLLGNLSMVDIKAESLFSRGSIGAMANGVAVGVVAIMAQVNYVHYVLRNLALRIVPADGPSMLKIKFICLYHAVSGLEALRGVARADGTRDVLQEIFSDPDVKWIRKQLWLRRCLMHYRPRKAPGVQIAPQSTFRESVEKLSRGRPYAEVNEMTDRGLGLVSRKLEEGFALSRGTFWYGHVSRDKKGA
jgi:hypothetical protein